MAQITEWTIVADIESWINEILRDRVDLPFSKAQVEVRARGRRERRDLTIYERNGQIALTGEIKLPNSPDGRSPFQEALVIDAHKKANQDGVEHFFTWNINRCVLWKTFEQGKPITERYIEHFHALPTPIHQADEWVHPQVQEHIKEFLVNFLQRCAAIITGAEPMSWMPLDEKFIVVWEASLDPLVTQTLAAIHTRYGSDPAFATELNRWMRQEQGRTLSKKDEAFRENLEFAAKLSCYVLANKIIFYKALRRRIRMRALRIPANIETGSELKQLLDDYFGHAIATSRDYETVFRGDFGDTLPFLNDATVEYWRDLSAHTDAFDFTQINYEIIGKIFEGMLSTTERHKFGQHYTRSEVVDLINSFCIREPEATVLDPACGGGTFLVRAYQRKHDLSSGGLTHEQLLNQLYGVDISAYPAHLTTINLATRDLIEHANYPLVVRKDFFHINPGDPIFHIPLGGGEQATWIEITKVNVVVGNPPYVEQVKINEYYGEAYKKSLQELAQSEAPTAQLSGRSDIYCYFFTHGLSFLNDDGYMGLLTSSTWLDTAYGFRLQKFLLNNFEIVAIFESNCEPWFTAARVTTAATILRRQIDTAKREANTVRFVWLKKPLSDFLAYARTEEDRRLTFEELRRHIESLTAEEETDAWRVRVVNQAKLYRLGCLAFAVSEEEGAEAEEGEEGEQTKETRPHPDQQSLYQHQQLKVGEYVGYKWGIFLRAPEIFFKLLHRCGDRFVPLGQIVEVRFGLKSGCDTFFFPWDITHEAVAQDITDREFKERYGIRRSETNKTRIVRAGDGSVHLIEAKYLELEIHGLMDIQSISINRESLDRSVVMIPTVFPKIDEHVRKYIRWGQSENFHAGRTCQSRISENRDWYDLTGRPRGEIIWPKLQQYRHVVAHNPNKLTCNCNLYDVFVDDSLDSGTVCAVLNSTAIALVKFLSGSQMGREGNQVTEIFDVKMMLVPDPRVATPEVRRRLEIALESMRKRKALPLVDVDSDEPGWTGELTLEDRQELDDAVLELLGISEMKEREVLRAELYDAMTKLYRQIRATERIMQRYRSMTARGGRPTPHSLAEEIWDELEEKPGYKTPLDFIPSGARCEEIVLPAGRARVIRQHLFRPDGVQIGEIFLELRDPIRCQFVKELSDLDFTGKVSIPIDHRLCENVLTDYRAYVERVTDEFMHLAATHTAEETMQERVVRELWKKMTRLAGE